MQKLTRISSNEFALLTLVIVFSMLNIISTAIDYMYQLYFLYMPLNYLIIYCCPKARVALNLQGTVFTLARLKRAPSYHQELVSHPMLEHIEALS